MKPTLRDCLNFQSAVEELKGRGSFAFRCAIAALAIDTKRHIEVFKEAQAPAKGITDFQTEVQLIRENCTEEKDGKKVVNIEKFMPLYNRATAKHGKAIEASEKLQKEVNAALDKPVEIAAKLLDVKMLEGEDKNEKFDAAVIGKLWAFVAE